MLRHWGANHAMPFSLCLCVLGRSGWSAENCLNACMIVGCVRTTALLRCGQQRLGSLEIVGEGGVVTNGNRHSSCVLCRTFCCDSLRLSAHGCMAVLGCSWWEVTRLRVLHSYVLPCPRDRCTTAYLESCNCVCVTSGWLRCSCPTGQFSPKAACMCRLVV